MVALPEEEMARLRALLETQRWAALATARDNEPLASWVAFLREPPGHRFLLHLSRLARHTRYIELNPSVSLAISESDADPGANPQLLARVSFTGAMQAVARDAPDYAAARARYLARFPAAAQTFELGDFSLFRLTASEARYVGGFGRAYRVGAEELQGLGI
jgi:putative heme iron utilization protein